MQRDGDCEGPHLQGRGFTPGVAAPSMGIGVRWGCRGEACGPEYWPRCRRADALCNLCPARDRLCRWPTLRILLSRRLHFTLSSLCAQSKVDAQDVTRALHALPCRACPGRRCPRPVYLHPCQPVYCAFGPSWCTRRTGTPGAQLPHAIQLDWWLWEVGERERHRHPPHHRTRTIYY